MRFLSRCNDALSELSQVHTAYSDQQLDENPSRVEGCTALTPGICAVVRSKMQNRINKLTKSLDESENARYEAEARAVDCEEALSQLQKVCRASDRITFFLLIR